MPRNDGEKIRLAGVGKRFATRGQEIEALRPTDMAVRAREFVALVGPSGCGKSTILNLIAGLPTSTGSTAAWRMCADAQAGAWRVADAKRGSRWCWPGRTRPALPRAAANP
jgi:ABC-type nitrate/sulfonate/bicarbonate transport system ATPase subunit